jgi:uncharacterized protein YvpB
MLRRTLVGLVAAMAALLPSAAHASDLEPPHAWSARLVASVVYSPQTHKLSCEAAALEMALSHEGITVTQDDIMALIPVDGRPTVLDGDGMHWGDPFTAFVGDIDGSEVDNTGYGTYFPTIAAAASSLGGSVLRAGQAVSARVVYAAVMSGHPVVAWISWDYLAYERADYTAFDGASVPYAGPVEHAVTVVGVSHGDVLIYDPHAGPVWLDREDFEAAYATFGQMAVILD